MGLATNSLETFISKTAVFLIRFPLSILAARFLGSEGKGLLSLLIVLVATSIALGNLGLGPASIYLISKDRTCLPVVVGNILLVTAIVGVVMSGSVWVFVQYDHTGISAQLPVWVWNLLGIFIAIQLLQTLLMQALSALLRIREINIIDAITTLSELLLFILFVVVMGGGVAEAFLAHAFASCLAVVSFFALILHHGGRPARPEFTLLRDSLRFGMKSHLSNLMRFLNLRLDTFLVAGLATSGVAAAGIYSVAVGLAELILFIPTSIRLSLFPMVARRNGAEINQLTPAACRHTLLLTAISALGLASLGPFAIHWLYGQEFTSALTPLLVLLPGVVMLSQVHIFYSDLTGRGKPGATIASALLSLIVTVTLDLVLIPWYGITGAALASTCAYVIEFVVAVAFFLHFSGLRLREVLVFRRADLSYYREILPRVRKLPMSREAHTTASVPPEA